MSEHRLDLGDLLGSLSTSGFNVENKFGRPGRVVVMMGQGKAVEASDNNSEIFTFGVSGCNAVAVEGTRKGKRFGVITHYDPLSFDINIQTLERLGDQVGRPTEVDQTNAEVFVRGGYVKVDDKWEKLPEDQAEAQALVQSVKKAFGPQIQVIVTPYSQLREFRKDNQGEVSIDISPSSQRKKRILGIF